MTLTNRYFWPLLFVGLMACSAENPERSNANWQEFDVFCQQITALVAAEEFASLSSEQRAARLDGMLSSQAKSSGDVYVAWSAIRNAMPDQRAALFREAADSVGYKDWQCPAIDQHAHQIGSAQE